MDVKLSSIDWLRTWLRVGERDCGMEGKKISVTLRFLICLTPENERVEKSIFSGREILRSSITKGYLTIQLDSDTTWVVASDFTSERAQFRKTGHISNSSCTWSAQATHTSAWPTTNSGVPTYPPPQSGLIIC